MAMVEERKYEEFDDMFHTDRDMNEVYKEYEEFDDMFHTDRDIARRHVIFKVEQDSDHQEVPCPLLRGGCTQGEFKAFAQQWRLYAGCHGKMDGRELRQQLLNCAVGHLEAVMYNALGSKVDTLTETKTCFSSWSLRAATGLRRHSSLSTWTTKP
jgi:hypothetical protein